MADERKVMATCPSCSGFGQLVPPAVSWDDDDRHCYRCDGRGKIAAANPLEARTVTPYGMGGPPPRCKNCYGNCTCLEVKEEAAAVTEPQQTASDLLPCPFCGMEPQIKSDGTYSQWLISCRGCESETRFFPSSQAAADAWNRRRKK